MARSVDTERLELLLKGLSSYKAASTASNALALPPADTASGSGSSSTRPVNSNRNGKSDININGNSNNGNGNINSNARVRLTAHAQKLADAADVVITLVFGASPPATSTLPTSTSTQAAAQHKSSALQRILVEEAAKVLGASTRAEWSKLRARSGAAQLPLFKGRSRLGVLVDPLGLFRFVFGGVALFLCLSVH